MVLGGAIAWRRGGWRKTLVCLPLPDEGGNEGEPPKLARTFFHPEPPHPHPLLPEHTLLRSGRDRTTRAHHDHGFHAIALLTVPPSPRQPVFLRRPFVRGGMVMSVFFHPLRFHANAPRGRMRRYPASSSGVILPVRSIAIPDGWRSCRSPAGASPGTFRPYADIVKELTHEYPTHRFRRLQPDVRC